jgi:PPOX class probable F420-dependent enzyme
MTDKASAAVLDALAFLATHHRAVLITRKRSGELQASPVAAVNDSEGRVVVSTREGSAKERNVSRNPAVSLCVVSDQWFGPWVDLDGVADVLRLPDAMEPLVDYYRGISGEHDDWDEYRRAMTAENRVLLQVRPVAAGPVVGLR